MLQLRCSERSLNYVWDIIARATKSRHSLAQPLRTGLAYAVISLLRASLNYVWDIIARATKSRHSLAQPLRTGLAYPAISLFRAQPQLCMGYYCSSDKVAP